MSSDVEEIMLHFPTYVYLFRLPGPATRDQWNNQPARDSFDIETQPIFLFYSFFNRKCSE